MMGDRQGDGGGRRTPLLRPGVHEGIDLELEHHIAERTERLIDEGWEPEAARREAERRFGVKRRWKNELVAEARGEVGRRWLMGIVDSVVQDVRYAVRGALRQPGLTLTLLGTLALGIGATGGVFSVIDTVLMRPLPYEEPDRLVDLEPFREGARVVRREFSAAQVAPWIEGADFLSSVARHDRLSMLRTGEQGPTALSAVVASANLDDVLGVGTALGRAFVPEDVTGDRRVVLLSWTYWRETGADPDIIGSEIELNETPWTVIGVLERGVKFPVAGTTEIWVPYAADGSVVGEARRGVRLLGRLAEGVSVESAQARADALAVRLEEAIPGDFGWAVKLSPVGEWRANRDIARGLWILGAGVLLMLVITVVNATNLLLVRGQGRMGEFGIRKALGASRGRVARQVVFESLLLSLAAGVVATCVAWASVAGIAWLAPREITFGMAHEFGLEGRALGLVFAVASAAGLAVGALPGIRLSLARVAGSGSASAVGRDRSAGRLRTALVTGEIAVSVILLVGAGLFLRSFGNVLSVDMGMATHEVAFATVDLPESRYASGADRAAFVDDALLRLQSIPGVVSTAVSTGVPPSGGALHFSPIRAEGGDASIEQVTPSVQAGPGFLSTLGAELVAGRELTEGDLDRHAVVIDQDLADLLFEGGPVVDQRFTFDSGADEVRWLTVAGVVEELAVGGADDRTGATVVIEPMNMDAPGSWLVFTVRTADDPADLMAPIRAVFNDLDTRLPLIRLETAEAAFGESLSRPRFVVLLFSVVAWLALALSAVGIYGVVSYAVRQRRREMGIRMALGAPASRVRGAIFRWGLTMAAVGIGAGVGVALQLDEAAEALLFGVQPGDLTTLIVVGLVMFGVTALACLLPALRATRLDPAEVLRVE
ncbi:MAG: ADOP family duplicated permease [Gemmatimonadota bacterium]